MVVVPQQQSTAHHLHTASCTRRIKLFVVKFNFDQSARDFLDLQKHLLLLLLLLPVMRRELQTALCSADELLADRWLVRCCWRFVDHHYYEIISGEATKTKSFRFLRLPRIEWNSIAPVGRLVGLCQRRGIICYPQSSRLGLLIAATATLFCPAHLTRSNSN